MIGIYLNKGMAGKKFVATEKFAEVVGKFLQEVAAEAAGAETNAESCDVGANQESDTFHDNPQLEAFVSEVPVTFDKKMSILNFIRNYAEDYADRVVEHHSLPLQINQAEAEKILADLGYIIQ